jgi:hypothetical protein
MNSTLDRDQKTGAEMSVVGRNLKGENEVKTMTTPTMSATPTIRSSANYGVTERLAAHLALALLRWSNRRADRSQPTHERMALMLDNERVSARNIPYLMPRR